MNNVFVDLQCRAVSIETKNVERKRFTCCKVGTSSANKSNKNMYFLVTKTTRSDVVPGSLTVKMMVNTTQSGIYSS